MIEEKSICCVCQKEFTQQVNLKSDYKYLKKCCGKHCSHSRKHTKETKEKIAEGVHNSEKSKLYQLERTKKVKYKSFNCPVCNNIVTIKHFEDRKTCGKTECISKHISNVIKEQLVNGKRVNQWGGRCRKITYIMKNGIEIKVDGNFELEFCKWCEENNVLFKKNRIGFKYIFDKHEHIYFPDFLINESVFVEVKGYETEKDRCKWEQFPYKIIILKEKQINLLKKRLINKLDDLKEFYYKQLAPIAPLSYTQQKE